MNSAITLIALLATPSIIIGYLISRFSRKLLGIKILLIIGVIVFVLIGYICSFATSIDTGGANYTAGIIPGLIGAASTIISLFIGSKIGYKFSSPK
jgi:hypothetical protein